ncbi:disulfide oxidoreductase [Bacillus sp. 2205SS5-2]|uniref:disulfide oxidoreductase n=1 Tax=Bacillus sp. 2205SS5-2 TaxID=3109031 RepID=UPI0030041861
MTKKAENILLLAWTTALLATMGSLYFSEIKGYEPCQLCWYQRILMYPMSLLLLLALWKKDTKFWLYSLALSGLGIVVSLYHYFIQKVSFFSDSAPACGRIPCTGEYINWFGFVTIPFLAFTAFSIIFICSIWLKKWTKEEI